MKKTLLLLAACVALTATAFAQRPDDRYDNNRYDDRRDGIDTPYESYNNRPLPPLPDNPRYRDGYGSQYNDAPGWNRNRDRRSYQRAFEDGLRYGYQDGFRNLRPQRLPRPGNPREAGFSDGYNRGLRQGRDIAYTQRYDRRGNGYGRRW